MIAIKNADGTLVPVAEGSAFDKQTVALSLVHSNQKRAEIQLFEIEPVSPDEHPPLVPGQVPFGTLVIKKLPENPFGEVEIRATIEVDNSGNVTVTAEADGIKPVSGSFRLPTPGDDVASAELDDFLVDDPAMGLDLGDLDLDPPVEQATSQDPMADFSFDELSEPPATAEDSDSFGETPPIDDDAFHFDDDALVAPEADVGDEALSGDEAPGASAAVGETDAFIDDPDDTDWGFDELADPESEEADADAAGEGLPADPDDRSEGNDLGSMDDMALPRDDFGDESLSAGFDDLADDKFGMDDYEDSAPAARSARVATAVVARTLSGEPPATLVPKASKQRNAPTRRSEVADDEEPGAKPAASQGFGSMPALMKASIVLFALSLIELGVYLALRLSQG